MRKELEQIKLEQQRQMINGQKHKVNQFYQDFLKKRHPAYPEAQQVIDQLSDEDDERKKVSKKLIEKERSKLVDHLQYNAQNLLPEQVEQLEAIRAGNLKVNTLGKLDKIQQETMRELQFYTEQQESLQQRLEQQERLLNAVK